MDEFASLFFASRTQAHIFHLGVKGPGSFAAHKALNEYYDEVVGIVDKLVESYQGKYGLLKRMTGYEMDNNCSMENIKSYFNSLIEALNKQRKVFTDSWIQNQIDTLEELLYSTKYKLTYLQ